MGRCYWRKNSRLIYLYPGKYDWEGSPAHGDCSLRIKVLKHFLHHQKNLSINPIHVFLIFPKNVKDDHNHQLSGNFSAVRLWHVAMHGVCHDLPGSDLLQGHPRLRPRVPDGAEDTKPRRDSTKGRCFWRSGRSCGERPGGIKRMQFSLKIAERNKDQIVTLLG